MKKNNLKLWLPFLLSIIMVLGMIIGYTLRKDTVGPDSFLQNKKNTAIAEVANIIDKMYVQPIDRDSLESNAINNLLAKLDPYSVYIAPGKLQAIDDNAKGSFIGIGLEYEIVNDSVVITNITKDGPADKAGIRVGDCFMNFNDSIPVSGTKESAHGMLDVLQKKLGNDFKVTLLRNGQVISTTLHKAVIPISSIDAAYMLDSLTAYVRLNQFSETTYRAFMLTLEKLRSAGMQQLIIDLRGNNGGVLSAAIEIANEFLTQNKLIVYTEGDKVGRKEYRCQRDGLYDTLKLALLVDETTASASEVLAGALQDWDRATIIGRRTFGKGLVQDQFKLTNGGALRLTVARYYTPLGRDIQKPYNKKRSEYEKALAVRFHSGEIVLGDTTSPQGKTFKTPDGHTLYGGGGITPDVFVPYDTTRLPKQAAELYLKNTLVHFTFQYYIQHRPALHSIKSAADLYKMPLPEPAIWQSLKEYALRDTIRLEALNDAAKANILEKFRAFLAKNMFGPAAYFEVNNYYDRAVKSGLQEINR